MNSVRTARAGLPITDQSWPLGAVTRLTGIAMIATAGAVVVTHGLLRTLLVVCGAGLGIVAAAKLALYMRGTRQT